MNFLSQLLYLLRKNKKGFEGGVQSLADGRAAVFTGFTTPASSLPKNRGTGGKNRGVVEEWRSGGKVEEWRRGLTVVQEFFSAFSSFFSSSRWNEGGVI